MSDTMYHNRQVGTVVENAADFYSGRVSLKKRKKTLVEEMLQDAELKKFEALLFLS